MSYTCKRCQRPCRPDKDGHCPRCKWEVRIIDGIGHMPTWTGLLTIYLNPKIAEEMDSMLGSPDYTKRGGTFMGWPLVLSAHTESFALEWQYRRPSGAPAVPMEPGACGIDYKQEAHLLQVKLERAEGILAKITKFLKMEE